MQRRRNVFLVPGFLAGHSSLDYSVKRPNERMNIESSLENKMKEKHPWKSHSFRFSSKSKTGVIVCVLERQGQE
jgi:hypothetical protein